MRTKIFLARLWALAILTLVVLSTAARATAQEEKVLHSFRPSSQDGIHPYSALILDASGNLYGTTSNGGAYGFGTVFEFSPRPGGGWTEKILHSFNANGKDGIEPLAGLTFDVSGNLYGTTSQGGPHYGGAVFELVPQPNGKWVEKILHGFRATNTDGYYPYYAGLVIDSSGNLYGTTVNGGTGCGTSGCGTVFELIPETGGVWTEAILHNFSHDGTDGEYPESGLIFDAAGNLYGTTFQGGTGSCAVGSGTAFELTPAAGGIWTEAILYNFGSDSNCADGDGLVAGLTLDALGNVYGTTFYGGADGLGTAFELTPVAGDNWSESVLYSFGDNPTDGYHPYCVPILDSSGNLYGTTLYGGAYGGIGVYTSGGAVFKLTNTGGVWTEEVVHSFGSGTDGNAPQASLIMAHGNLYGTTTGGGTYGDGTVSVIKP